MSAPEEDAHAQEEPVHTGIEHGASLGARSTSTAIYVTVP